MPLPGRVVLDSRNMDRSLCEALTAVTRNGKDATEFLRLVCAHCKQPYECDEPLRPALEALKRTRATDPTSHAWWTELAEADNTLMTKDWARIKMCEYLCLVVHLEAIGVLEGSLKEDQCLKATAHLQEILAEAF